MKLTTDEIEEIMKEKWLDHYLLISDPKLLREMAEEIVKQENER